MWNLVSLVMLIAGCIKDNNVLVITSGLFAIAGSIEIIRSKA